MNRPNRAFSSLFSFLLAGCAVDKAPNGSGGSTAIVSTDAGPANDYGSAPDFTLPDVAGGAFRLSGQARVVVLTFVTADCTEDCPKVEAVLRSVAQRLRAAGELGKVAEVASIEVDPKTNSVKAVRELRQRLWPAKGWAFLRGDARATQDVLKAYDVHVFPRQPGKDLEHESLVYVISSSRRKVDLLEPEVNLTPQTILRAIDRAHRFVEHELDHQESHK